MEFEDKLCERWVCIWKTMCFHTVNSMLHFHAFLIQKTSQFIWIRKKKNMDGAMIAPTPKMSFTLVSFKMKLKNSRIIQITERVPWSLLMVILFYKQFLWFYLRWWRYSFWFGIWRQWIWSLFWWIWSWKQKFLWHWLWKFRWCSLPLSFPEYFKSIFLIWWKFWR